MKRGNRKKCVRLAVALFAVLLVASGTGIGGRAASAGASTEQPVLEIYRDHGEDAAAFQIGNMLPGDAQTQNYTIQVSYTGSVTLRFHADIRSGYEHLTQVLKCRVAIRGGAQLYDGLMKDMPSSVKYTLPESGNNTAQVVYSITAYLDTGVGNEYMGKQLFADLRWWVDESDTAHAPTGATEPTKTAGSDKTTEPTKATEPTKPGQLTTPATGDDSHVVLWGILAAGAAVTAAILFLFDRKKEVDVHER